MRKATVRLALLVCSLGSLDSAATTTPSGPRPSCTAANRDHNTLDAGSWRPLGPGDNVSSLVPPCCGWDGQDFKKKAYCAKQGMPKLKSLYHGGWDGYTSTGGRACQCAAPSSEYLWSDTGGPCAVEQWDAGPFCAEGLPDNGKLMVIGDSTAQQTASVLMNMVRHGGGTCGGRVWLALSDTLVGASFGRRLDGRAGFNRGLRWIDYVAKHSPDVVVLSAGAHVYGDANFTGVLRTVANEAAALKRARPGLRVLWKTQQPGATSTSFTTYVCLGCADALVLPHQVRDARFWTDDMIGHNHRQFLARDDEAATFFSARGIPVVDVRMLYARADAHHGSRTSKRPRDCLHYCLKSTALSDTFPRMLLHTLLRHGAHASDT